jgi:hypothetical protein
MQPAACQTLTKERAKRVRNLINRLVMGGDIRVWRTRHSEAATRAFHDLAARAVAAAEAEAARLDWADMALNQRDFLSSRVKTLLRDNAEPLAEELIAAANEELALLADAEVIRIRSDDYAVLSKGLVVDLSEAMLAMLPMNRTALLHEKLRDYVHTSLIAGPKGKPAILEQLISAYAEAGKRALKA